MADTTKNASPAQGQQDQEHEALVTLLRDVWMPRFTEKLAQHGIRPQDENELIKFAELGQVLLDGRAAGVVAPPETAKTASQLDQVIAGARQAIDQRLGANLSTQKAAAMAADPRYQSAYRTLAAANLN